MVSDNRLTLPDNAARRNSGRRNSGMHALFVGPLDPMYTGAFDMAMNRISLLERMGYEVVPVNAFNSKSLQSDLYEGRSILLWNDSAVLREAFRADLVFVQGVSKISVALSLLNKLTRGILLVDEPADDLQYEQDLGRRYAKGWVLRRNVSLVRSNAFRFFLQEHFHCRLIRLLYYNIEDSFFEDNRVVERDAPPVIVHAGKMDGELSRAFAMILRGRLARLILIGSGRPNPTLEEYRRNGQLTTIAYVPPHEIRRYLALSDLFLVHYPYSFMDQSQKFLRYMAMGAPIVTNEFLGIRGLVNHEHVVFVRGSHFPEDALEAVRNIVRDPQSYREITQACKQRAFDTVSTGVVAKELAKILVEACE